MVPWLEFHKNLVISWCLFPCRLVCLVQVQVVYFLYITESLNFFTLYRTWQLYLDLAIHEKSIFSLYAKGSRLTTHWLVTDFSSQAKKIFYKLDFFLSPWNNEPNILWYHLTKDKKCWDVGQRKSKGTQGTR